MKRKMLVLLLFTLTLFSCAGCNAVNGLKDFFGFFHSKNAEIILQYEITTAENGDVAICVQEADGEYTLKEVMDIAVADKTLSFEIASGMITSLNGKANTANSFWMLYTTDGEMANSEWGTIAFEGLVLGSAVLGAEALTVAVGEYYVWSYQSF